MLADASEAVVWVCLFGTPIVMVVAHSVFKIIKYCADNELKRAMIERGLSAEEIERILAAGSKNKKGEDEG